MDKKIKKTKRQKDKKDKRVLLKGLRLIKKIITG